MYINSYSPTFPLAIACGNVGVYNQNLHFCTQWHTEMYFIIYISPCQSLIFPHAMAWGNVGVYSRNLHFHTQWHAEKYFIIYITACQSLIFLHAIACGNVKSSYKRHKPLTSTSLVPIGRDYIPSLSGRWLWGRVCTPDSICLCLHLPFSFLVEVEIFRSFLFQFQGNWQSKCQRKFNSFDLSFNSRPHSAPNVLKRERFF